MRPGEWGRRPVGSRLRLGARLFAMLLIALTGTGCFGPSSRSMATVPPEWRDPHPWGPTANEARARGDLRPAFYTQEMAEWAAFGRRYLQDGDILFCRGAATSLDGRCITRFFADVTDSPFSHEGIAHWCDGTVWVYDVKAEGVRDMPFEFWILDVAEHSLAVRRVRPIYRDRTPQAVAFCRECYLRQVPYDMTFSLDDDALYCAEMVEKAYCAAGLPLSEPVPIRRLPNYASYRLLVPLVELCTDIDPDTPVFAPGNEYYGTYSSPYLEEVFQCEEISEALRMCKAPVAESE